MCRTDIVVRRPHSKSVRELYCCTGGKTKKSNWRENWTNYFCNVHLTTLTEPSRAGVNGKKTEKNATKWNKYGCGLQHKKYRISKKQLLFGQPLYPFAFVHCIIAQNTHQTKRMSVCSRSQSKRWFIGDHRRWFIWPVFVMWPAQNIVINRSKYPLSIYLKCGFFVFLTFGNYKFIFCRWHNVSARLGRRRICDAPQSNHVRSSSNEKKTKKKQKNWNAVI